MYLKRNLFFYGGFFMPDNIFGSSNTSGIQSEPSSINTNSGCFREAVCIDAYRVYDSCADKDCLEDLRVHFTEAGQHVVDGACSVRIKDVDVITVYVNLEPVPFNKGFYSVDMTFFFEVNLDVFLAPASCPVSVCGLSVYTKKVILFGSDGNVKIFTSGTCSDDIESSLSTKNLPKATVQVADPIGLNAKITCDKPKHCEPSCHIPECINRRYGGEFVKPSAGNFVYVTIGIFTIVQIERSVQMLIPTYDFCVPEKECITASDDPCELFSRLEFPTDEFFPPKVTDLNAENLGGCGKCH